MQEHFIATWFTPLNLFITTEKTWLTVGLVWTASVLFIAPCCLPACLSVSAFVIYVPVCVYHPARSLHVIIIFSVYLFCTRRTHPYFHSWSFTLRHTDTDTQTDIERDRDGDTETERQTYRQTGRDTDTERGEREKRRDGDTERQRQRETDRVEGVGWLVEEERERRVGAVGVFWRLSSSCKIFTCFVTSLLETDGETDRDRNRDRESQTDGDKPSAEV